MKKARKRVLFFLLIYAKIKHKDERGGFYEHKTEKNND